jgi:SNF family Na+-dependent transporter
MTLLIVLIIILVIKCIFNPGLYKTKNGFVLYYTPMFNRYVRKEIQIKLW